MYSAIQKQMKESYEKQRKADVAEAKAVQEREKLAETKAVQERERLAKEAEAKSLEAAAQELIKQAQEKIDAENLCKQAVVNSRSFSGRSTSTLSITYPIGSSSLTEVLADPKTFFLNMCSI
jgi:hypothetical protein